jgi:hypothetical protein
VGLIDRTITLACECGVVEQLKRPVDRLMGIRGIDSEHRRLRRLPSGAAKRET